MGFSCRYRLTQLAIDWQVPAADARFYDVLFIGTGQRGSRQVGGSLGAVTEITLYKKKKLLLLFTVGLI